MWQEKFSESLYGMAGWGLDMASDPLCPFNTRNQSVITAIRIQRQKNEDMREPDSDPPHSTGSLLFFTLSYYDTWRNLDKS